MISEKELKSELDSMCSRLGVQSYLLTYLEGDQVHFTGSAKLNAFLPFLMDKVAERILRRNT